MCGTDVPFYHYIFSTTKNKLQNIIDFIENYFSQIDYTQV